MALSPGGARAKGQEGEREAARLLQFWATEAGFSIDPTRNLDQTREGGYDLNGVPGLGVEVKRVEAPDLTSWWNQCLRQADKQGVHPLLMHRANRKPWRFRTIVDSVHWIGERSVTVRLTVDLDESQAKRWFQTFLYANYT